MRSTENEFLSIPGPSGTGFKLVTENFPTFFTAREEICHLELTLGASSPKDSFTSLAIWNRVIRDSNRAIRDI